jgi:hypothetical protein
MTSKLHLASDLALPVDAVTQTFLIVGKRGSGKSNTAARIVEQLHHAGCPFVVLDPVDNWWGLKAARDGRGAGLKDVYVFGGSHADLPLEPGGGELMADVLCDHRSPMVLSVKHFTGGERSRFMTAFALRVLRRWSGGVLHVVLEEAHEFAPQSIPKGEQAEQMLGAFKRLWKLGRASGIGGSAVTQRPASLSKDITTQAEILVAHRTIGPQDVDAIKGWIRYHQESEETLGQLAELRTGEAFVYSPEFPEGKAIGLRRVTFDLAETFDSRATPKPGERRVEPKALAPVDLEKLRTRMAGTIERAKADDPRELRRRIAELEKQVRARVPAAAPPPASKVREVPVLKDGQVKRLEAVANAEARQAERLLEANAKTLAALKVFRDSLAKIGAGPTAPLVVTTTAVRTPLNISPEVLAPRSRIQSAALPSKLVSRMLGGDLDRRLGRGETAILCAAAQHHDQGGVTRDQLTVLTGYKRSSRDTFLQRLAAAGHIDQRGDRILATDAGVEALGPEFDPLPKGEALRAHWLDRLGGGEKALLELVIGAYPDAVEREVLSEASGYQRSSRDTFLQRLAARRLIVTERGAVRASDLLFS